MTSMPRPSALATEAVLPRYQRTGRQEEQPIAELAEHLAIDQESPHPFRGAHELGRDDEHPAEPEPRPEARDIGGQDRRQENTPRQRPGAQAEDAGDLDHLAVNRKKG